MFSVVHAQMGPCFNIELRVWHCRTNRRPHYSDMHRTSGTHRNTWTDGFGCRHTMLVEYHHCQHLISKQWIIQQFNNIAVSLLFLTWMWIPSKRRKRSRNRYQQILRVLRLDDANSRRRNRSEEKDLKKNISLSEMSLSNGI